MDEIMVVLPGETEDECLFRIGEAKKNGLLDLYWQDIADFMNKNFRSDETEYRTESSYRKKFKNYIDAKDILIKQTTSDDFVADIAQQKRELEKAKIKLRDEKLEYNRWLRENARDEAIAEKIIQAVRELTPLVCPEITYKHSLDNSKSAILCFGDEHYSAEFKICGLYGEILNEYNPDIFEDRMWRLLKQTVDIVRQNHITMLNVFALGDFCDGVLRVSQLMKLRYGVVEGSVRYAEFIANWLNELSKYVYVRYQMTYGNHTELRQLGQPKGTFKDDNTGLFVREIIKTRLENNQNFEMVTNPTGLIFDTIEGFNVLAIHGEVRNMDRAIKDFSTTYNVPIHILIGGHMHHYKAETVGFNREVINVPSIIGIDDYAMSLNKTSKPGATLLLLEEFNGVSVEHKIKL